MPLPPAVWKSIPPGASSSTAYSPSSPPSSTSPSSSVPSQQQQQHHQPSSLSAPTSASFDVQFQRYNKKKYNHYFSQYYNKFNNNYYNGDEYGEGTRRRSFWNLSSLFSFKNKHSAFSKPRRNRINAFSSSLFYHSGSRSSGSGNVLWWMTVLASFLLIIVLILMMIQFIWWFRLLNFDPQQQQQQLSSSSSSPFFSSSSLLSSTTFYSSSISSNSNNNSGNKINDNNINNYHSIQKLQLNPQYNTLTHPQQHALRPKQQQQQQRQHAPFSGSQEQQIQMIQQEDTENFDDNVDMYKEEVEIDSIRLIYDQHHVSSSTTTKITTPSISLWDDDDFPLWIQEYVTWHHQMRKAYPGMELFTNPSAPKLLIRTCLGLCGGLHDRIGQLPWDIYLAYKTKRLLLIAWQRPRELENFLIPPHVYHQRKLRQLKQKRQRYRKLRQQEQQRQQSSLSSSLTFLNTTIKGLDVEIEEYQQMMDNFTSYIDWTVPEEANFGFDYIKEVRASVKQLFEGYPEDHPDDEFWNVQLDLALNRAMDEKQTSATAKVQQKNEEGVHEEIDADGQQGSFANEKILRHRILGHLGQEILEDRLRDEGLLITKQQQQQQQQQEKDDGQEKPITDEKKGRQQYQQYYQLHRAPIFGKIFWLFFRPVLAIEREVRQIMMDLHLNPNTSPPPPPPLSAAAEAAGNSNNDGIVVSPYSTTITSLPYYTAVHCRVRHPKISTSLVHGKNPNYPADKTGLPWEGGPRQYALQRALLALQCLTMTEKEVEKENNNGDNDKNNNNNNNNGVVTKKVTTTDTTTATNQQQQQQQYHQRIYFMSDSNDLVRHVTIELADPTFFDNTTNFEWMNDELVQLVQQIQKQKLRISSSSSALSSSWSSSSFPLSSSWIVARNNTEENAHIDRQKGRPPRAYYATFIDLLLAMHAKCIIYGIGYYSSFASKISGSSCAYLYQHESWGEQTDRHQKTTKRCPNLVLLEQQNGTDTGISIQDVVVRHPKNN